MTTDEREQRNVIGICLILAAIIIAVLFVRGCEKPANVTVTAPVVKHEPVNNQPEIYRPARSLVKKVRLVEKKVPQHAYTVTYRNGVEIDRSISTSEGE